MPFTHYPAVAAFTPTLKSADLFTSTEGFGEDWDVDFGSQKVFYVRGTRWFRREVEDNVTQCEPFISGMKAHLDLMQNFGSRRFKWNSLFSRIQVYSAWNNEPISFDKAVQVILLCAIVAEERYRREGTGQDGTAVLGRMRIEPAVYLVRGLDTTVYEQIAVKKPDYWDHLAEEVSQRDVEVFRDMAQGQRVTLRLANEVHDRILEDFPDVRLGQVSVNGGRGHSIVASKLETVDRRPYQHA